MQQPSTCFVFDNPIFGYQWCISNSNSNSKASAMGCHVMRANSARCHVKACLCSIFLVSLHITPGHAYQIRGAHVQQMNDEQLQTKTCIGILRCCTMVWSSAFEHTKFSSICICKTWHCPRTAVASQLFSLRTCSHCSPFLKRSKELQVAT